jgi:cytochrome c oxidase subunit IV
VSTEQARPGSDKDGRVLRIIGLVVAIWGAVLLSSYGAFMTPYRVGGTLVPVAILLAVGGNAGLIWYAYHVTGWRRLSLLPGIVWIVASFQWSARTGEGDLVLTTSNWVGTVYLVSGWATIFFAAYRLILGSRRP